LLDYEGNTRLMNLYTMSGPVSVEACSGYWFNNNS